MLKIHWKNAKEEIQKDYKKALAGEITNLTGLQAPYEEPKNPELILDTERYNTQECLEMIIKKLEELGYLK